MLPKQLLKSLPSWMRPRGSEILYYYEGNRLCRYSPDQPRDDHGRWTDEGNTQVADTDNIKTDASGNNDSTKLSAQKIGNIIFNETRSLSSLPGSDINDARMDIAYMIRNGEDYANEYDTGRPITASDSITGFIPAAETETYNDSQNAAIQADAGIKQGMDPTNGAMYMSIVNDNTTILNGKTLTVSTGPFHNSFPNKDVPAKTVYINFSK